MKSSRLGPSPLAQLAAISEKEGLRLREISIERIHPDPDQPRVEFGGEDDEALANSIKEQGLIAPLLLRPHPELAHEWMIIVGERRWRACERAQLQLVPAQVRSNLAIGEIRIMQLAENENRKGLNDIERARGLQAALDANPGLSQADLARRLGRDRSYVSKYLALSSRLDDATRRAVEEGRVAGPDNAIALAGLPEVARTALLAKPRITRKDLQRAASVAQAKPAPAPARPRLVERPEPPGTEPPPLDHHAPEPPVRTGRPRLPRRISAALLWEDWLAIFSRFEIEPPASPDDLADSLLKLAARDA